MDPIPHLYSPTKAWWMLEALALSFCTYSYTQRNSYHFAIVSPQDVQYGDIDYMVRMKDFTYDADRFHDLPEFVRSIKKDGLRYIIILVCSLMDCYVTFTCSLPQVPS